MLKSISCFLLWILSISIYAQDTTKIKLNLTAFEKKTLAVEVIPPKIKETRAEFIIPKLVPGTYWTINYSRFYSNFKAYDKAHKRLKTSRKGNSIVIDQADKLTSLCYTVCESTGNKKFWDNAFGCGGTTFTKNAFLLNYDLIAGYFKGYEQLPMQIDVKKPVQLYASTSQKRISSTPAEDCFSVKNYFDLVDKPTLYCKADTCSFTVGESKFYISVYAEKGHIKSQQMKPAIQQVINCVHNFFSYLPVKEYHFLFYAVQPDSLKGFINRLGLYTALEHVNSSVYFMEDIADTNALKGFLINTCMHEFLHLWTPLTIHSDKIEDYNFEKPDMSENIWFYEGFTDYLTDYIIAKNKLYPNYLANSLSGAIGFALKQKPISFSTSCLSLQSHTIFNAFKKFNRQNNCYERGKLVAFCLDLELMKRSRNTFRLEDLMNKLYNTYAFKGAFKDAAFTDILVDLSYPEIKSFMERYIKGDQLPPYVDYLDYLDMLGWSFIAEHEKRPSYGSYTFTYNFKANSYFFKDVKPNCLNVQNNDTLMEVNGKPGAENWSSLFYPEKNDSITIKVNRNGQSMVLKGLACEYRKFARNAIIKNKKWKEQSYFFNAFFYYSDESSLKVRY